MYRFHRCVSMGEGGYLGPLVPGLWSQVLSRGYPVLVLARGVCPSQVLGQGYPLPLTRTGVPSSLTRTEVPPSGQDQDRGTLRPGPGKQHKPWTGYSAGSMPLAFSRKRTFLFPLISTSFTLDITIFHTISHKALILTFKAGIGSLARENFCKLNYVNLIYLQKSLHSV